MKVGVIHFPVGGAFWDSGCSHTMLLGGIVTKLGVTGLALKIRRQLKAKVWVCVGAHWYNTETLKNNIRSQTEPQLWNASTYTHSDSLTQRLNCTNIHSACVNGTCPNQGCCEPQKYENENKGRGGTSHELCSGFQAGCVSPHCSLLP